MKKMSVHAGTAFICLLFLSGCALPGYSYKPYSALWDAGYTETRLGPDMWRVTYRGFDDPKDRVADLTLLRAAWLCNKNGYPWFIVTAQRESPYRYHFGGDNLVDTSLMVNGLKSQSAGALNSAFLISSLSSKYRISRSNLEN